MWESPITITTKIEEAVVDGIVLRYGVRVDKDELIKALEYSKDSYNRGYADGYRDGMMGFDPE